MMLPAQASLAKRYGLRRGKMLLWYGLHVLGHHPCLRRRTKLLRARPIGVGTSVRHGLW